MDKTLKITFKGNSATFKVKTSIAVLQSGFQIRKQDFIDNDESATLLLTVSQGKKPLSELIGALNDVPEVVDVREDSQAIDAALEESSRALEPVVNAVVAAYPNFMSVLRDYEHSLPDEIRAQMMFEIGQRVGAQIYTKNFAKTRAGTTAPLILEQIVIRSIKPFAIVKTSGSELQLSVCPFSVNPVSSGGKECEFLSGFISGLFESTPEAPAVRIVKAHCKARGEGQCTFQASS